VESEYLYAAGLIAVLIGLAGYYGRRQWQALRGLVDNTRLSYDEKLYVRNQARRRLTASVLMVLAAGMLVGSFWMNAPASEIAQKKKVAEAANEEFVFDAQDALFARCYALYWIVFLLILMMILFIAALDLFAIRRFGIRQHRKIQQDRKTMIERQVMRMRIECNGHQEE
jgi:hypothetical protein